MPKTYWVATYRAIHDADKVAAYAKLAGPALQAAGGRFLARGNPAVIYDNAVQQRVVLIEFDSVAQARAAYSAYAGRCARSATRSSRYPHRRGRVMSQKFEADAMRSTRCIAAAASSFRTRGMRAARNTSRRWDSRRSRRPAPAMRGRGAGRTAPCPRSRAQYLRTIVDATGFRERGFRG